MKQGAANEEQTKKIAANFATGLKGGETILLVGELGAGKTTFVKGLGRALGIVQEIVSPTFTLLQVYETTQVPIHRLVHVDTYRLDQESQLREIGLEDYLNQPDTVVVIEWPEKLQTLLTVLEHPITIKLHTVGQERE